MIIKANVLHSLNKVRMSVCLLQFAVTRLTVGRHARPYVEVPLRDKS